MNILNPNHNITASAPATLMLMGEHAVLYGYPAIVCAVDKRMQVTLTPRNDTIITIHSPALGSYQNTLDHVTITPPFHYVTAIIQHYLPQLTRGFDLHIRSDFAHTIGFGSSAAVSVATIAVFEKWLQNPLSLEQIYLLGYDIVQKVQQVGSGADIAASTFGGVGFYQRQTAGAFQYEKLTHSPPLVVVYSGSKEPTSLMIAQVARDKENDPQRYQFLFQQIGNCSLDARTAINQAQWKTLGTLFNHHYQLQVELGISNDHLEYIIQQLKNNSTILGAKISGSGLGDCIIGIGQLFTPISQNPQEPALQIQPIAVKITSEGVRYE